MPQMEKIAGLGLARLQSLMAVPQSKVIIYSLDYNSTAKVIENNVIAIESKY